MNLQIEARSWPEADRLFRTDPWWRGSDDAYSVHLGGSLTLWLFGDTFIGTEPNAHRRRCHFIRNSIGIQSGLDPSNAEIAFHWGTSADGTPDSFFTAEEGVWLWPLHGCMVDGALLLFFMKVRSPVGDELSPIEEWRDQGPLGFFEVFGYRAFIVRNPAERVASWRIENLRDDSETGIVCGAAMVREGEELFSYGWRDKQGYLCKWPAATSSDGRLEDPVWWNGLDWTRESREAAVVLDGCPTEFTVHRDEAMEALVEVQLTGVMDGWMSMRIAQEPSGPFTEPKPFHLTEESGRPGVFVYAGKAHPHLEGARLVCTYASNGRDVDETLDDDSIYYPRFVRVERLELS